MTIDTLRRIATAAGCRMSEFFEDENEGGANFDLTAFIDCGGQVYKANNFKELENLVNTLRTKG